MFAHFEKYSMTLKIFSLAFNLSMRSGILEFESPVKHLSHLVEHDMKQSAGFMPFYLRRKDTINKLKGLRVYKML